MKKTLLILIIICCVGITEAGFTVDFTDVGATITSDPVATGYAIDYDNYNGYVGDGVFDKFFGSRYKTTPTIPRIWREEDVRVGLPTWGEARGIVEFYTYYAPDELHIFEEGQNPERDEPIEILYLDKICIGRWWASGSNAESNTSLYGYVGDGYMGANDVYETDLLIASNIGSRGPIDVTDFVNSIKYDNPYAGFVLKENKSGMLLNYGEFWLDAYYVVPEPSTLLIMMGFSFCGKIKHLFN